MPRRPKTAQRRPAKQERSQETVSVLIAATERVLTKEGYAAATTNRIAEVAVAVRELVHAFVEMVQRKETLVRRWYMEVPHLGQLEFGLELTDRATRLVRAGFEAKRAELRASVRA